MAPLVKCLSSKHEDLSFTLLNPCAVAVVACFVFVKV